MSRTKAKPMGEVDLAEMVERACGGDGEAFSELYRKLAGRVFGLCRHLLGSADAAEDATSEVFLRAQRAMNTYDQAVPFPRWLFSIASHYCVDRLRRRRVEARLFTEEDIHAAPADRRMPSPLGHLLAQEDRERVREVLAGLPERFRVPLILRYYSELSYDEIGVALGLTRGNVATLLFRAKKELRSVLRPELRGLAR